MNHKPTIVTVTLALLTALSAFGQSTYVVVDTIQTNCYSTNAIIAAPAPGAAYAGQDAQYAGTQPSYTLSGDGLTVLDNNTGLTWERSPDTDGNGSLSYDDKLLYSAALLRPATMNAANYGGYSDWRLPMLKELYSLILFNGKEASETSSIGAIPFINTNYFGFAYGFTNSGERVLDAQWVTTNLYVAQTNQMFGVNFADGRIKGYPATDAIGKKFFVLCVRGNTSYGVNNFADNGGGTITDNATGLMWQKADSGAGKNWQGALAYAEGLSLAGWQDWRLPNPKELHSIVDYTRSPDTTGSAAIDPIFSCTQVTNENNAADYPFYWTGTTLMGTGPSPYSRGIYISFGRTLGYMGGTWTDVHGAGAQRAEFKAGNPADYPFGFGPQGDAVRIFNYVRCVRGGAVAPTNDTDADGLTDWYEYNYVTNTTAMTPDGDIDGDGFPNSSEYGAGTSPINAASYLGIEEFSVESSSNAVISWRSVLDKRYRIERSTKLVLDTFWTVVAADIPATPPVNIHTDTTANARAMFYRVAVEGDSQ
ncbi:MAG: DUF1566 domain-containing protein [bacterium]|nr:DUF1566 domain-containing protein [bacterium]